MYFDVITEEAGIICVTVANGHAVNINPLYIYIVTSDLQASSHRILYLAMTHYVYIACIDR